MKKNRPANRRDSGFTMIEMMISVMLILIVVGAIFRQIQRGQASYRVESQKLDITQQEREFIDQFTRDVRQAGYPGPFTQGIPQPVNLNNTQVSAGITAISPNSLTFEADLNNSGQVQIVTYSYLNAAAPCPCIQRTSSVKGGAAAPATYTAVQNLIDPGAAGVFTAYAADGTPVALPLTLAAGATTSDPTYGNLRTIRSVRVSFTLQGTSKDLNTITPIQVTMSGMARIPNH